MNSSESETETYRNGVLGKEHIVAQFARTRPMASMKHDDFVGTDSYGHVSDPNRWEGRSGFAKLDSGAKSLGVAVNVISPRKRFPARGLLRALASQPRLASRPGLHQCGECHLGVVPVRDSVQPTVALPLDLLRPRRVRRILGTGARIGVSSLSNLSLQTWRRHSR